ncbi:MAG TPA: 3-phosphoshikimate 1-carboxyvinyltransferase [Terriglobia bacterium]|nr:3-phosphoshikimate 1-carboxyvinyltransferase [Terriglobia bacterium]
MDQHPSSVVVKPARNLAGSVRLPGDKSISHRYAMLAAIARGNTRLENFSTGADCASTLASVSRLGAEVRRGADERIEIAGSGPVLRVPAEALDCGNSGSTMRMLAGILAGQPFTSELVGDSSLSRRPMKRIMEPLSAMGAKIVARDGHAPLSITGGRLRAIDYQVPVASAQVKTCLLFAALFASGVTSVEEPLRTRDHGELALRAFGAELTRSRNRISIAGGQQLAAIEAFIPGDLSSAAFFLCAAALFPESNLVIEAVLMNPTRAGLLDVLTAMGGKFSVLQLEEHHGELMGTVQMHPGRLKGATISGALSAALIDELPVLAAIGPYTSEGVEIRDAAELRVKESDRIAVVASNLRAMGAEVEEFEDGMRVRGGQEPHGAEIDSAGDHRIAMAFAVAALRAHGDTVIHGADAARISYPEFFSTLEGIVER